MFEFFPKKSDASHCSLLLVERFLAPKNPPRRVPAPATERPPAASPPSSRRDDSPEPGEAPPDPALKRKRGRGHPNLEPPAALPAVTGRDPLWRILTIHRLLAERPRTPPTAASRAKEIGISPRTIQRDIATMQHTLRLPIESLAGNGGGYRYTRRTTSTWSASPCAGAATPASWRRPACATPCSTTPAQCWRKITAVFIEAERCPDGSSATGSVGILPAWPRGASPARGFMKPAGCRRSQWPSIQRPKSLKVFENRCKPARRPPSL